MTTTMIFHPNSATSLLLGKGLLSEQHNLLLYFPREVHRRMAFTIPYDLRIEGLGLGVKVETVTDLQSIEQVDFLVFPFMDVLPEKKRVDFAKMCRTTIR